MEEYKNEQTQEMAQNNKEEQVSKSGATVTEVSFGKFKDANALLSAYNALEAEFTKRCQRVKELEAQTLAVDKEITPTLTQVKEEGVLDKDKNDILKEYLKDLLSRKQSAIVLDGTGVGAKTPTERPKTLEQAGILAKDLLNTHL